MLLATGAFENLTFNPPPPQVNGGLNSIQLIQAAGLIEGFIFKELASRLPESSAVRLANRAKVRGRGGATATNWNRSRGGGGVHFHLKAKRREGEGDTKRDVPFVDAAQTQKRIRVPTFI